MIVQRVLISEFSSWAPSAGYTAYPSTAFKTNDFNFMNDAGNSEFAISFAMGEYFNGEGTDQLYYSISADVGHCSGITATSLVGTSWPPSGSVSFGASGLETETSPGQVSYSAAVGAISQLKNSGLSNTVGMSCSYVGTDLTTLNSNKLI